MRLRLSLAAYFLLILILEVFNNMNTNIGCRWQGRSSYLSDSSSVTNNDLSSSEVCYLELMWNF